MRAGGKRKDMSAEGGIRQKREQGRGNKLVGVGGVGGRGRMGRRERERDGGGGKSAHRERWEKEWISERGGRAAEGRGSKMRINVQYDVCAEESFCFEGIGVKLVMHFMALVHLWPDIWATRLTLGKKKKKIPSQPKLAIGRVRNFAPPAQALAQLKQRFPCVGASFFFFHAAPVPSDKQSGWNGNTWRGNTMLLADSNGTTENSSVANVSCHVNKVK